MKKILPSRGVQIFCILLALYFILTTIPSLTDFSLVGLGIYPGEERDSPPTIITDTTEQNSPFTEPLVATTNTESTHQGYEENDSDHTYYENFVLQPLSNVLSFEDLQWLVAKDIMVEPVSSLIIDSRTLDWVDVSRNEELFMEALTPYLHAQEEDLTVYQNMNPNEALTSAIEKIPNQEGL